MHSPLQADEKRLYKNTDCVTTRGFFQPCCPFNHSSLVMRKRLKSCALCFCPPPWWNNPRFSIDWTVASHSRRGRRWSLSILLAGRKCSVFLKHLPWFHFFLQWLCVWHLGSLLPVKIPVLSTVLELPVNSSVHYRPLLLEQRKKTMKMLLWGISVLHLDELALQLLVWCLCIFL